MSTDRYYKQRDGKWECIVDDQPRDVETGFWVDISHGRNILIDERYYFHDLASALEFYLEGWGQRQYLDDEGNVVGLDHKGLYSRGRLIQRAFYPRGCAGTRGREPTTDL